MLGLGAKAEPRCAGSEAALMAVGRGVSYKDLRMMLKRRLAQIMKRIQFSCVPTACIDHPPTLLDLFGISECLPRPASVRRDHESAACSYRRLRT